MRVRSPVPVAMDETAAERGAPGSGAADAVCLKISRCGGISGLLRDARAARAAGTKVYVASTLDGPLGHRRRPARRGGAARLRAGRLLRAGHARRRSRTWICWRRRDGEIAVPAGPGLLGP